MAEEATTSQHSTSNQLQGAQAGGSHVVLDVPAGQQTLPEQAAQDKAQQQAARDPISDRETRTQDLNGLSTQWGSELAGGGMG